ncbi:MAG: ABC transporter permease subunit [Iamia sp.]
MVNILPETTLPPQTRCPLNRGRLSLGVLSFLGLWMFSGLSNDGADLFNDLPEAFDSLIGGVGGGANYLTTEVFGLVAPIVLLVIAIGGGVAALAGEEKGHTAGLLFAQPVTRRGVVVSKAAVMVVHVLVATVVFLAGFLAGAALFGSGTSTADILATTVHLVALVVAFGMIALALSVATGSSTTSTGVAAGLAVAADLSAGLLPLSDATKSFEVISPWYYYNGSDPMSNGLDPTHLLVQVGLASAGFAAAILLVAVRDIGSGGGSRRFALPDALDRLAKVTRPRLTGVFTRSLSERTLLIAIAGGSLASMAVGVAVMFNGLQDTLAEMSADLPSGITGLIGESSMGTPAGWMNAEMMSILAPMALIGVAVWLGAGAIAGEERDHTLDMLLAAPVRRSQVVLEKAAALFVVVVAVSLICGLGIMAGSSLGGLDLGAADVFGAMAHLALLGLFFGYPALALGSAVSYSVATRATIVVAVVSYLMASFFPQNATLADWAAISPWYYYSDSVPLVNGADPLHLAVLAVLAAVALAAAVPLVERREVTA